MGTRLVPFYSTREAAKSLAPSNICVDAKGHGKVSYKKCHMAYTHV